MLNDRERRIFEARRLADEPVMLEELADEFGVSRERVRQTWFSRWSCLARYAHGYHIHQDAARVSGKETAQETLLGLGIDTTKPIETQRDFAHLRWWREIAEGMMKAAVIAMALGFGGTLATLVWLGFKISLSQ